MPKIKQEQRGIISPQEVKVILSKCTSLRDQALITVMYITGFRISEIVSNRAKDHWPMKRGQDIKIYTENGIKKVMIAHTALKKRTKSNITEVNKMYLEASQIPYFNIIEEYYNGVPEGFPLFPFTRTTADRIIKKYNGGLWCHLFRHTRATLLTEQGHDLIFIMQWFNYSSPTVAMRYFHRRPITEANIV